MSDPTTITEVLQPIWDLLRTSRNIPSGLGEKALNRRGRRYSWEPTQITPSDPSDDNVDEARRLHDLDVGFDVIAFAPSLDDCLGMAADLVTAIRQILRGANYTLGAFSWSDGSGEPSTDGWALTVPVTIKLGLLESDLDQDGLTEARITSVSGSVDFDDGP